MLAIEATICDEDPHRGTIAYFQTLLHNSSCNSGTVPMCGLDVTVDLPPGSQPGSGNKASCAAKPYISLKAFESGSARAFATGAKSGCGRSVNGYQSSESNLSGS